MSGLKEMAKGLLPRSILTAIQVNRELWTGEPELRLVPKLLGPKGVFLDVGGNLGTYSAYALRFAREVHVFEPHPRLAGSLRDLFGARATVHEVALSDRAGQARFNIPLQESREIHSRGSVETCHEVDFARMRVVDVTCRTLDSFDFPEVGLIKIDVEGHEGAVLRGAAATLERCRPSVIVEVEEFRVPGSVAEVTGLMQAAGYRGFHLLGGEVRSLDGFDVDRHQLRARRPEFGDRTRDPDFVNNFIFVHPSRDIAFAAGDRI